MGRIDIGLSDSLVLQNDEIHALVDGKEYIFKLSEVEEMAMFTTDDGPQYCDNGLAINLGNGNVIFIWGEHPCFSKFLFEQIGKAVTIDYEAIIEASQCFGNKMFVIYKK